MMDTIPDPEQKSSGENLSGSIWENIHLGWMDLSEIEPSDRIIRTAAFGSHKVFLGLQRIEGSSFWLHTLRCDTRPVRFDLVHALKACLPPGRNNIYAISSHQWFNSLLEVNGFTKRDEILQFGTYDLKPPEIRDGYQILPLSDEMIPEAFACETVFPPVWRLNSGEFSLAVRMSDWKAVISQNGQVIAYLLAAIQDDNCHINRLAVSLPFQNRGAASALIKYLYEFCENKGIKSFSVNTNGANNAAVSFYRNMNFVRQGQTYPVCSRSVQGRG